MRLRTSSFFIVFALCVVVMAGCEEDTKIQIDGKNPPTLRFTGSGEVLFIRVIKEPSEKSVFTPTIGANGDGIKITIKKGGSIKLN